MSTMLVLDKVSQSFAPSLSLLARLTKQFRASGADQAVHAVDGVSLTIRAGEVLALVGESGCGKSTLGRMVAGIQVPSAGSATLAGHGPMTGGRQGAKTTTRVQMVFQDPFSSLDPRMRIGDTVAEGPIAHGLVVPRDAAAYVTAWLGRVGLASEVARRYPHQFSGGQRQRIAIARALAMQPDVLVCDEPVASLDVSIQAQIVNLFLELRRELGLTMLFISHDLGVVKHIADRVAVMYLGRIVEIGTTSQIFGKARHPYTRALLASVPKLRTRSNHSIGAIPILGEIPSPIARPTGCHFHPRCPRAAARCRSEVPTLDGQDSSTACFYPDNGPWSEMET